MSYMSRPGTSKPGYPQKALTVDVLLKAAKAAAEESSAVHPDDVAIAMSVAIENAASVLHQLHIDDRLRDDTVML